MFNIKQLEDIKNLNQEEAVYEAANFYIDQGIFVLPLRPNSKLLPDRTYNINYGSASRKKAVIDKWFKPGTGRFAGWNIGIACGKADGIFAVDIDISDDVDGFLNWDNIVPDGTDIDAPIQSTPRGGRHIIFKWKENSVSSTGKLAKGVDTRGGESNKCKSHIVVFPSIVDGKRYEWESGSEIPEVPDWILEKMGKPWTERAKKAIRGNENMDEGDLEQTIPLDQVARMLSTIDIDDLTYDEWLRIGQAIHSQHPGHDGLETWDEWSRTGSRYEDGECRIRWDGFDQGGTVRVGTLFYYAKRNGWEKEPEDITGNKWDELVAELNSQFAIVLVGNKIRVLYEKEQVLDPSYMSHYELLSRDDFKMLLSNKSTIAVTAKGEPKKVPVADVWLASEERRTYLDGIGLFPDGDKPGFFNTWRGFTVKPEEGDCGLTLEHIKDVICCGDEFAYNWLVDWLADAVQDPANPKGCAVVMKGQEGTGKGTLANLMCEIFGYHGRHLIDDSHLTSNFNAHMIDALMVFADEITWGGNKKTAGKLKGMVTERYLLGERKGVDVVPYRNMVHLMIASNEDWVIPAGPQSRRWFVLEVDHSRRGDKEYFDNIIGQLESGGKEAFLKFLLEREIENDLTKAPSTEALVEQRARQSQNNPMVMWWSRILERGKMPPTSTNTTDDPWPEYADRVDLYEHYETWCISRGYGRIIQTVFYRTMEEYGLESVRSSTDNRRGKRGYDFKVPPLWQCAEAFEKETAVKINYLEDIDDENV